MKSLQQGNAKKIYQKKKSKKLINTGLSYHVMLLPGMIFLFIFTYIPMAGIIMAFQDYVPAKGLLASPFVGLENFSYMFSLPDISKIFRNTIVIALGKIILGTLLAIVFSIMRRI